MIGNKRTFKKRARDLFLKNNPTADIEWVKADYVTYPTGVKGWYGLFTARAPGHHTRTMVVNADEDSIMIR